MLTHRFPGYTDNELVLRNHQSYLGTGGVQQRANILCDDIDDTYADERMVVFNLAGNLDAPELLPSGATVKRSGYPVWNVHTEPGSVRR